MNATHRPVNMTSDGVALSPREYAELLVELSQSGQLEADSYGAGGSVASLERAMADELGKQAAVVMPTGTLANLLAVEYLAGRSPKVAVQAHSHIYNDCGDCAPRLAGLQLLPLGDTATFGAGELRRELDRAADGKVLAPIGAVSVETPVRRLDGEMFEESALQSVIELARDAGLGLHLDGARLPVVAAYTGRDMADFAAAFDTVYVSLYKCFNSLSGGILAGDEEVIGRLRHWRRRNGGGMAQLWPIAAVAHRFLPGVVERLTEARQISETFFARLRDDQRFEHHRVENGTTVSRLSLRHSGPAEHQVFSDALGALGVRLPAVETDPPGFVIKVNESWRQMTADGLFAAFDRAHAAVAGGA